MTTPANSKRIRASERAILVAIKAIQSAGLSVDKLLINGAQVEIRCTSVEGDRDDRDDAGLKQW